VDKTEEVYEDAPSSRKSEGQGLKKGASGPIRSRGGERHSIGSQDQEKWGGALFNLGKSPCSEVNRREKKSPGDGGVYPTTIGEVICRLGKIENGVKTVIKGEKRHEA